MTSRTPRAVSSSTDRAAAAAVAWAAVVLAVAVWLSADPVRSEDLGRMAGWVRAWTGGAHLYGAGSDVDYPPWAIVVLAPLAWVPDMAVVPLWILFNGVCAMLLARALMRGPFSTGRAPADVWILGAAAIGRTLNQFSLPTVLAGVLAMTGGSPARVWLALSLVKPQIGIVFMAWLACRREWRDVALAAVIPLGLTFVYARVAGVAVTEVPGAYLAILAEQQSGLIGRTEVFWHVHRLMPWMPAILLSLAIAGAVAWHAWRRPDAVGYVRVALASLLAVRHQSYDLILLLPWVVSLGRPWFVTAAALVTVDPAAIVALIERWVGTGPVVSPWADPAALIVLLAVVIRDNKRQEKT